MVLVAERETSILSLAELRKELRYKLHEMAKELSKFLGYELPVDRYKNYEYGYGKTPVEVLNAAARIQAEQVRRVQPKPGYIVTVAIAAYKGVMAGHSLDQESYYELEDLPLEVPAAFLIGGIEKIDAHEVIRISGNSMASRVNSGDRVVIFKDDTPRQNTIVFVESPDHRLYLKCLRVGEAKFILESYSDHGLTVDDMTGWKIHGYAIAILGDPDSGIRNIEWNDGRPLKA